MTSFWGRDMDGLSVVFVFGVLIFVTLFLAVRIVPQGMKYVVQRLGKFHKNLSPGFNLIIPYVDSVAYRVTTKDIVLDIPSQEVITKDNAVLIANAVAYINILSPEKAVYGIEDYELAIRTLVQTSLRSIVGEMDLDDALSSRDMIKAKLKDSISDDISDWGIILKTVEIQDIKPSPTMQHAMEEQAAAERARRATVTRAEGERVAQVTRATGEKDAAILQAEGLKQAAILEAEARLEASRRDAAATIVLAEANREALLKVASAVNNESPVPFVLGEKYIEAMAKLGDSDNSKLVVLPADLPAALRGFVTDITGRKSL